MVTIKGREYTPVAVKDSFTRRAVQFRNNLIVKFKKMGISEDDVDIPLDPVPFRNVPATVSWWLEGQHLHFSYGHCNKYVENLYIVSKVLEAELDAVAAGQQTPQEFLEKFAEERDIVKVRAQARETLGLPEGIKDLDVINKAYKELAKEHHPDKAGGDTELFKKINNAHKVLKRELS
jgi:hypothetical protein